MTQRVRKTTLLVAFALFQFPLVHLWFSPILAVVGARQGVVVATLLTYGTLAATALLFGRAYCGWCCDGAAIQECCTALGAKRLEGRRYWPKYVIFGAWLAAVAGGFLYAGGFHRVDLQFGMSGALPIRPFLLLYGPFLIHVPLSFLVGRWAFCHYGCWIAPLMIISSRLKERAGWPSLRMAADPGNCLECEACAEACPMSLDVPRMVLASAMRSDECILCGSCAAACPSGAVRFSFSRPSQSTGPKAASGISAPALRMRSS